MSVLADFLEFKAFAVDVNRSVRTVERWTCEPNGLPYTKAGNLRLIHVPTAREWLLERMRRRNPRQDHDSKSAPKSEGGVRARAGPS
jgi:hypothetical protein